MLRANKVDKQLVETELDTAKGNKYIIEEELATVNGVTPATEEEQVAAEAKELTKNQKKRFQKKLKSGRNAAELAENIKERNATKNALQTFADEVSKTNKARREAVEKEKRRATEETAKEAKKLAQRKASEEAKRKEMESKIISEDVAREQEKKQIGREEKQKIRKEMRTFKTKEEEQEAAEVENHKAAAESASQLIARNIIQSKTDKTFFKSEASVFKENPKTEPGQHFKATKLLLDFITETIKKKNTELECPVCFEEASIPIFSCLNGHLVCKDCR